MIINEKQYMVSKSKVAKCNEAIDRINSRKDKSPYMKQILATSLEMFRDDILQEIREYETLKKNKQAYLKERLISDLPGMLTEYKIKAGLTQKEFAQKLGIKEQQLQRYEANSFTNVTFNSLIKYFNLLGLEVRIKKTRITKPAKNQQKKKNPV